MSSVFSPQSAPELLLIWSHRTTRWSFTLHRRIADITLFCFQDGRLTPLSLRGPHVSARCFQVTNTVVIDSAKWHERWSARGIWCVRSGECLFSEDANPDAEMNTSGEGCGSNEGLTGRPVRSMQRDVCIVDLEMFYYRNVVQSDNYCKEDSSVVSYIRVLRVSNLQAVLKNSSAAGKMQHQGSCCTSRTLKLIFFQTSSSRTGSLEVTDSPFLNSDEKKKKKKEEKAAWPKKKNLTCLVGTWSNQTSKINHNFISHCFTSNTHPIWINKYSTEWHYFGE